MMPALPERDANVTAADYLAETDLGLAISGYHATRLHEDLVRAELAEAEALTRAATEALARLLGEGRHDALNAYSDGEAAYWVDPDAEDEVLVIGLARPDARSAGAR